MDSKWLPLLTKLGDTAKRLATEIPAAIADTSLTIDQAQRLWEATGKLCDQATELIENMEDDGADETLIEPAEALEDILLRLHEAVGNRLIDLGGLRGPLRPDEMDEE